MAVKLEYGYYGGYSLHLGAYSYRGFDIVISNEHGNTPVEGDPFTMGFYEEGMDETDHLFDIMDFSMERAVNEVDSHIDFLLASGYKEPDQQIRQMRMLLKHTHDMEARKLVEAAIEERQKELSKAINSIVLDMKVDSIIPIVVLNTAKSCTCGAKHTSNPNFHATWCDNK